MQQHNLIQGSPEWHAYRAQHDNASDAPAMLGLSIYKTRTELMTERKTGLTPDVNSTTQKLFDDGHKFEALSRPLAEKIIGEELSPVTGSLGRYSASFDGLTLMEDVAFEHKTLNDDLRAAFADIQTRADEYRDNSGDLLPLMYQVQMEQQLLVSGAEKCLFMATKWNGEELVDEEHTWYLPNLELRQKIIDGWAQFAIDLADYVPVEIAEKPKAAVIMALPSLAIQIKGEVTHSNLIEFKEAATVFIANIKTELVTDEDFSNAEEMVKFCKAAEENIEITKASAIAQTTSIDELMRTLDFIKKQLSTKRLALKSLVDTQKLSIKTNAVSKAKSDWNAYLIEAEKETHPIRLNVQQPDFVGATTGLKTIKSLHSKIGDAIANGKIVIDAAARDIRAKQAWLKENADGFQFLFADIQTIVHKQMDDLQVLAKSRIADHKAQKAAELEADRVRIQAEEEEKARAKVALEASENARIEQAKLDAFAQEQAHKDDIAEAGNSVNTTQQLTPVVETTARAIPTQIKPAEVINQPIYFSGPHPSVNEIVCALAVAFHAEEMLVHKWLLEADFTQFKIAA
ncbi:MAG TPA: YqaJ viral recombinase family protein [Methylotenera sp.]|nr:YqaJ viral recombinase family protein [Methylotenera sp.]